jgi:hypothetical protein
MFDIEKRREELFARIDTLETWCDKHDYDHYRLMNHKCFYCIVVYFARKIIKLRKKL